MENGSACSGGSCGSWEGDDPWLVYRQVHYSLAGGYAAVSLAPMAALCIRKHRRLPVKASWANLFHLLFLVLSLLRMGYFLYCAIIPDVHDRSEQLSYFLFYPASFMIWCCYTIVLGCWVEFYHGGTSSVRHVNTCLSVVIVALASICACWLCAELVISNVTDGHHRRHVLDTFVTAQRFFSAFVDTLLAVGYAVYGLLMTFTATRGAVRVRGYLRRALCCSALKVGVIALACVLCFAARPFLTLWARSPDRDEWTERTWWFDLTLFGPLELLPLLLTLLLNQRASSAKSRSRLSAGPREFDPLIQRGPYARSVPVLSPGEVVPRTE
eukprot:m51a1_g6364 hypothetical protein (327) ;mRNA; r:112090-113402